MARGDGTARLNAHPKFPMEELSAKVMDRVMRGKIRYFDLADNHPARAWIEEA